MNISVPAPSASLDPARLAALIADLGDIPVITEEKVVRKRSRDFFLYSPVLNEELAKKSADIIAAPRTEAEVIRVAAACARHRIPLTPRGGATGNYGQAVPLRGGVRCVADAPRDRSSQSRSLRRPAARAGRPSRPC